MNDKVWVEECPIRHLPIVNEGNYECEKIDEELMTLIDIEIGACILFDSNYNCLECDWTEQKTYYNPEGAETYLLRADGLHYIQNMCVEECPEKWTLVNSECVRCNVN